jgi:hypothetical protein
MTRMPDRGTHPVEWLRGIALSLERLAAQGVASGAVRGATDELRAGVPEDLDAQVRVLVEDTLAVLGRLVSEAARSETPPLDAWSRTAAEGAVRGAVEEMRRLVPDMQPTTRDLLGRLRQWLDHSQAEATERARVLRSPADIARLAAAGAVAGAADQLGVAIPALTAPAAELATRVGRGVVRGAVEEAGNQVRVASRNPVLRAVVACGAAAVATGAAVAVLLAVRRR